MNSVNLVGRLVKNIEVRYTNQEIAYTNFSIAIKDIETNNVDFINCVLFGNQVLNLSRYCEKGDTISIQGKLKQDKYNDVNTYKVYCKVVNFINSKRKD